MCRVIEMGRWCVCTHTLGHEISRCVYGRINGCNVGASVTSRHVTSRHLAAPEGRVGVERPAVEGEGEEEVVARVGTGGVTQHQLRVVHL